MLRNLIASKFIPAGLGLCFWGSALCRAQDFVISASRMEQEAGKSGATATVLTAEDIRDSGASDLPTLLAAVPGLDVLSNGAAGQSTSVFTRGANSNQTAVYVDGIRLQTSGYGSYDLSSLGLVGIERIEVVRGPQSAVSGSDAMGGGIYITTARGSGDPDVLLSLAGGSRRSARGGFTATGSKGPADWSLSVQRESTDGWSSASESRGNLEKDGFGNNVTAGRIGLRTLGSWDLTFRRSVSRREIDNGAGLENLEDFNLRNQLQASLTHRLQWTTATKHLIRVGTSEDRLEDPGLDGGYAHLSYIRNIEAEAQVQSDHGAFQEALGLSVIREEDRYLRAIHATTAGVFGEGRLALPRSGSAVGTLRVEQRRSQDKVYGAIPTYRLAARMPVSGGLGLRGTYGTAHRFPGLGEFFPPYGNPNLKPEKSLGREIAMTWESESRDTEVSLAQFRTDYEDLIQADSFYVLQNIAVARVEGAEFIASQRKGRLTRNLSYTRLEARDLPSGSRLPRRARHKIAASGSIRLEPLGKSLILFGSVRAEFDRAASIYDSGPMDDFLVADAGFRWELKQGVEIGFRLENLGDRVYESIPGFTTPRRTAYLTLEVDANGLRARN